MAATRQTSQRITLVMLVLVSITVITLDYRGEVSHAIGHVRSGVADALAPFQRGIAAVLHPFGDVVAAAFHYGQLQSENAQLQHELGVTTRQLAGANYAKTSELFNLDGLPFAPNVPTVSAELISSSTSNFAQEVEIDRGTSSGVGPGMPVVAANGLIGTIVAPVSAGTAWIQLLTAASSSIAVEDPRAGFYLLSGKASCGTFCIPTTTGSLPPRAGDMLVTSGKDAGAYPPAIPVGTVRSVRPAPGGLSSSVSVQPVVDLSHLQYVDVLQWLRPA